MNEYDGCDQGLETLLYSRRNAPEDRYDGDTSSTIRQQNQLAWNGME